MLAWIAAGAPKGDPRDLPPARLWKDDANTWTEAEKLGLPHLVIASTPHKMPAQAQDAWSKLTRISGSTGATARSTRWATPG